ncbi:hypothetical protein Syun_009602 [Stephania yunnanensis]|uniref:Uncharacterized protein n=1 Tax=Stephania yunnanensis TaxID=152371 RepID=A0AAP0KGF8_9MAGN
MNSYTSWFTQGKNATIKIDYMGNLYFASRPYARDRVFQIPIGSYYTKFREEDQFQDSLISKLLSLGDFFYDFGEGSGIIQNPLFPEIKNARTLQALLENVERRVKFQTSRMTFYRYFSLLTHCLTMKN